MKISVGSQAHLTNKDEWLYGEGDGKFMKVPSPFTEHFTIPSDIYYANLITLGDKFSSQYKEGILTVNDGSERKLMCLNPAPVDKYDKILETLNWIKLNADFYDVIKKEHLLSIVKKQSLAYNNSHVIAGETEYPDMELSDEGVVSIISYLPREIAFKGQWLVLRTGDGSVVGVIQEDNEKFSIENRAAIKEIKSKSEGQVIITSEILQSIKKAEKFMGSKDYGLINFGDDVTISFDNGTIKFLEKFKNAGMKNVKFKFRVGGELKAGTWNKNGNALYLNNEFFLVEGM